MATGSQYFDMVEAVRQYYGSGSDQWVKIAQHGIAADNAAEILSGVPGVNTTVSASGKVLDFSYQNPFTTSNASSIASDINSNAGSGSVQYNTFNVPAQQTIDSQTGNVNMSSSLSGNGTSSGLNFVSNVVTPAVAAVGIGVKLGKWVDSALYNLNPDFWDNNGMSTINPNTWNDITADMSDKGWEGVLKRGFNAIYGLNPNDNKSQMYLDENAVAYLAQYMQENGFFPEQNGELNYTPDSYITGQYPNYTFNCYTGSGVQGSSGVYPVVKSGSGVVFGFSASGANDAWLIAASQQFFTYTNSLNPSRTFSSSRYFLNGKTFYVGQVGLNYSNDGTLSPHISSISPTTSDFLKLWGYIVLYGTPHSDSGNIQGVTDQPDATQPDFSNCSTPADYRNALRTQYPDMFNNAVTQTVVQPDGSVDTHTYVPVGTPDDTSNANQPTATETSQENPEVNPDTATETLLQTITDIIQRVTTNPPDTGDGDTPVPVVPTGSASSLWGIYNPTQAQLNSFGGWLWSDSFIEQIKKLFNNPMESIIGVHKIFASPSISGSSTIKVGYLDSGVSSNVVGAQYTDIDCGSVSLRESFGNVFDYIGTEVSIYLPFIGIQQLDVADVMRSTISVVYHVDVLSGACLAEVKVTRDSSGGTLYQFAGDCAVRYPISSGSYIGIVGGLASATLGAIGSAITGTPYPALAGASALANSRANVQHSGAFTGNAGAMGIKKPYLIISRVQSALANNFSHYQGYPANQNHSVGAMNGYFKMADVHLENIATATKPELEEIENLLLNGVVA